MAKDYYKTLGVSKNASAEDIKKAFRQKAHQYHPDKSGGDEAKFKEVNEAYQVLRDPKRKEQYDQFGTTFDQRGSGSGFGGFDDFFRGQNSDQRVDFDFGDIGDIFGDFFGMRGNQGRSRSQRRGSDIQVDVEIEFHEAAFGVEKNVMLRKDNPCQTCKGSGAAPGSKLVTCTTCKGTGQVVRSVGMGIGFQSVCNVCDGVGQKAETNCKTCHGRGTVNDYSEYMVKIPAGIDDGQSIILRGKGQSLGIGGEAGDLYVRVRVKPSDTFEREGYNIFNRKNISISQAVLGDRVEIKTLDGTVILKIPAGTESGKIFQLRDKGVQKLNGSGRGDHLVEIIIDIPKHLNRKQKKLLNDLSNEGL